MSQKTCQQTKTISERIIFDKDLNDKKTLFGGKTLSLLDENAGLASFKFVKGKTATAGYDHINFWNPITTDKYIKMESFVTGVYQRQIEVFTKIISRYMKKNQPKIAFNSFCTLIALKSNNEIIIPEIVPETAEEKYLCQGFETRLKQRKAEYLRKNEFLGHLSLN